MLALSTKGIHSLALCIAMKLDEPPVDGMNKSLLIPGIPGWSNQCSPLVLSRASTDLQLLARVAYGVSVEERGVG